MSQFFSTSDSHYHPSPTTHHPRTVIDHGDECESRLDQPGQTSDTGSAAVLAAAPVARRISLCAARADQLRGLSLYPDSRVARASLYQYSLLGRL